MREFFALQESLAGRYSLERELGRGGMGIVFLARDVALERAVAVKLLPPELASEESKERFLREARTAARLSHPHIVSIHLVEERNGLVYFVMPYIDGESLGQRIRRSGPLPPKRVERIVREVAWALAYAHQQGVVHRDIKSDNILIEKGSGRAMVTDFGIARVAEAEPASGSGELVGTASYMSPEQAAGVAIDGRSDLYSIGVTAFYALTGRHPFHGANLPALIHQHANVQAPRVADVAAAPLRLAEAVDRCLAKRPDDRFANAEALAEALGTSPEVPVPAGVRSLLRWLRMPGILGTSALVVFLLLAGRDSLHVVSDFAPDYWFDVLLVIFGGWGLAVVRHARRLLKEGIDHADVRRALLGEARARIEESLWERRAAVSRWQLVVGLFGFGTVIASGVVIGGLGGIVIAGVGSAFLIVVMAMLLGWRGAKVDPEDPAKGLTLLERLIAGRFGKWLFRIAGRGIERPEERMSLDPEHTEVLLGRAAERLYDELPSDVRRRIGPIAPVIDRLQRHIDTLREREAALSRASGSEGLRSQVRGRLEQAVAALETIRLDVLRLHAGAGSPDGLTADIERAQEIGREVDAEVAGWSEVEAVVKGSGPTSNPPVPSGG